MKKITKTATNPVLMTDYPDPDIIRVGDTFYMISTTMHMMPGGVILRSYNLVDWEIASYIYTTLDSTPKQTLEDQSGIYGKGMWAASIRYHEGIFYVCFVANDTGKTYIYTSKTIEGPWEKHTIEGFFHDNSILFDEDGRVFIVYGNRKIFLTELKPDLSGVKEGGINKLLLEDDENHGLGFEGTHFYKINGKYYLFFIHWPKFGNKRRTEACYCCDTVDGDYKGCDVMDDDMGFRNAGVAQGGIVDTPDGDWYSIIFQDHGALGRIPVLVPVTWKDDFPVFGIDGKIPKEITVTDYKPGYSYAPLYADDDFNYTPGPDGKVTLKNVWQWNHEPNEKGWSVTERPGFLRLRTTVVRPNVTRGLNTLTQRTFGHYTEGSVVIDGTGMKDGDFAGISAFMGKYCMIALTKENGSYSLVQLKRSVPANPGEEFMGGQDLKPGIECGRVKVDSAEVTLKVCCHFGDKEDYVEVFYLENENWVMLGERQELSYRLDHFMGCRLALSYFSTEKEGGVVDFTSFKMSI